MALTEEQFENKLNNLSNSKESIERISAWCSLWRSEAKQLAAWWENYFSKADQAKRLSLVYLANDVLQTSRRKGPEFVQEFYKVLPRALQHFIAKADDKTKASVLKVVQVWNDRKVFGSSTKLLLSLTHDISKSPETVRASPKINVRSTATGAAGKKHDAMQTHRVTQHHTISKPTPSMEQGHLHRASTLLRDVDVHSSQHTAPLESKMRATLNNTGSGSDALHGNGDKKGQILGTESMIDAQVVIQSYSAALQKEIAMRESVIEVLQACIEVQKTVIQERKEGVMKCGSHLEAIQTNPGSGNMDDVSRGGGSGLVVSAENGSAPRAEEGIADDGHRSAETEAAAVLEDEYDPEDF